MNLQLQIITLITSFFYGMLFGLFINVNYKIIYNQRKYIKYIGSTLVILINVLLYFIILQKINYAYFHPYCIIMLTIGYVLYIIIVKHFKKWYNYY